MKPEILSSDVSTFLREARQYAHDRCRINPLTEEEASTRTELMRETPLGAELGLVVLDDSSDSNCFCLITQGVAAGSILRWFHDDVPRVAYPSLNSLLLAFAGAFASERTIDELDEERVSFDGLSETLDTYLDRDDEAAEACLTIFIPLLANPPERLVSRLASHDDFYVREAVATSLTNCLTPTLEAQLAADPHPQVRGALARAKTKHKHSRR